MQDVKIILTDSLTGLSPDANFIVYDTATDRRYFGNGTTTITEVTGNSIDGFVFVRDLSDLPAPVSGVITLLDNYTYFFTGVVDLAGNRLTCGENTTILGGSSENCRIKSTGLNSSTALITSVYSLPMRNITIEHGTALDLDAATGTAALDWFGVNFTDCATVGVIANYSNVIWSDCALLNSAGLSFDGEIGTVGFSQCIFVGRVNGTTITLPSTLEITRRFRIIYSAFVGASGGTGINASTSATIPVEGYILDTVNFSGNGTYTAGILYTDNKALFINNRGIVNSAEIANYYMSNNATVTDIVSTGVAVKAAGTTTANFINQKFTHTNNRATYTGAITRAFEITAVASVEAAGASKEIGFYVAKNNATIADSEMYITTNTNNRAESVAIQTITELATNDYIEIWIENETDNTDVTVTYLNVIVKSLN